MNAGKTRTNERLSRAQRIVIFVLGLLLFMCLAGISLSALGNLSLPTGPQVLDRLDPLDKARLQETQHLKHELGEAVWPGWGKTDIPILLWNQKYSFLIGFAESPKGWEVVSGDDFDGQPYYRQPTHNPQNFAVLIEGRQVASLATKWETDAFLIDKFREMMPGPLKPIFPYWLLVQATEVQMTGLLHESFHAYQAEMAPKHFVEAEDAYTADALYWNVDENMRANWQSEIDALLLAVKSTDSQVSVNYAHQFLTLRDERRIQHNLDPMLVNYERQIEWLEGLAKYIELQSWREASTNSEYEPLPVLAGDSDFKQYTTFSQRWSQELDQLARQANVPGDVRFYYTGMAQAVLLDSLLPNWKDRIFSDDVALEDLLREAVSP